MKRSLSFLSLCFVALFTIACSDDASSLESTAKNTTPLISEQPLSVSFEEERDTLYFEFEVTQPGVIEISTDSDISGIGLNLKEKSQADYLLANELLIARELIEYGPVGEGTYQLTLNDMLSSNSATQLTLKYVLNDDDAYELNQDTSSAYPITIGESYSAYLRAENDKDYFKFELAESSAINIHIITMPEEISTSPVLLNESGEEIALSEERQHYSPSQGESGPGTYYVVFTSQASSMNPYEFQVDI